MLRDGRRPDPQPVNFRYGHSQQPRPRTLRPTGRVAIVTVGAGLPGYHHGAILADARAHVVLLDLVPTEDSNSIKHSDVAAG
jgi:hypothetical protein